MTDKKVLVVEDEPNIASLIQEILSLHDRKTALAGCAADALKLVDREPIDCAVIDLSLPDMNGLELYRSLSADYPHLRSRIIFMSGMEPDEHFRKLLRDTANRFIQKPFHLNDFRELLNSFL